MKSQHQIEFPSFSTDRQIQLHMTRDRIKQSDWLMLSNSNIDMSGKELFLEIGRCLNINLDTCAIDVL